MPTVTAPPPGPRAHTRRFRISRLLGAVRRDQSGVSMVEFALALPVVVTLGMYGMEIAYMATAHMQISQLALAAADNASRLGQTDNSAVAPSVSEQNISAVLEGAEAQGAPLNFATHGRIILSSLEQDAEGQQYIHWQRCAGNLAQQSDYGGADPDRTGDSIDGLGKPEKPVRARADVAVMYVEVFYDYQPLFGSAFVKEQRFKQEAAFVVRDDRKLDGGVTGGMIEHTRCSS